MADSFPPPPAGPPPMPLQWATLEDENRGPEIVVVTTVMTALAVLSVLVRFYTRINIVHNFGRDDATIAFTLALSVAMWAVIIPEVQYGAGRHHKFLDPAVAMKGLQLNFITQPLALWSIAMVKVSIAFFLLRLAPNPRYVRGLYAAIIFILVYTTGCFFTIVFQCRPIRLAWDFAAKGQCFSVPTIQALAYVNASFNIFTDLVFVIIPIAMVYKARINKRTKMALVVIMSLGVFACAAACVKLSVLSSYGKTGDFLWDSTDLTIWSAVELNIGIIVASAPAAKPLFRRVFETVSDRYGYSNRSKDGTTPSELKVFDKNTATNSTATARRGRDEVSEDDAASEQSILRMHSDGIMKTMEVSIHSTRKEGDEDTGGERWGAKGGRGVV